MTVSAVCCLPHWFTGGAQCEHAALGEQLAHHLRTANAPNFAEVPGPGNSKIIRAARGNHRAPPSAKIGSEEEKAGSGRVERRYMKSWTPYGTMSTFSRALVWEGGHSAAWSSRRMAMNESASATAVITVPDKRYCMSQCG